MALEAVGSNPITHPRKSTSSEVLFFINIDYLEEVMISFAHLNKAEKSHYLPLLFDVLYSNMEEITPTGKSYEEQKQEFLTEVAPALEKEPRKIVLCYRDNDLAGFLMYYTRDDMLMIEELQLKKKYQRTRLLH